MAGWGLWLWSWLWLWCVIISTGLHKAAGNISVRQNLIGDRNGFSRGVVLRRECWAGTGVGWCFSVWIFVKVDLAVCISGVISHLHFFAARKLCDGGVV